MKAIVKPFEVKKETAKATLFVFLQFEAIQWIDGQHVKFYNRKEVWIPNSLFNKEMEFIAVQDWFYKKNGMCQFIEA